MVLPDPGGVSVAFHACGTGGSGGLLVPRLHTVCVHFLRGNVGARHITFRGHAWQSFANIRAAYHTHLRLVHLSVACTLPRPRWARRTTVGSLYRSWLSHQG